MALKDFLNRLGIGASGDDRAPVKPERKLTKQAGMNKIFHEIHQECIKENPDWYPLPKVGSLPAWQDLKSREDSVKIDFIFYLIPIYASEAKRIKKTGWRSGDTSRQENELRQVLLSSLLRTKLRLNETELMSMMDLFRANTSANGLSFTEWPIGFTVSQIVKFAKTKDLSDHFRNYLEQMLKWPEFDQQRSYWGADVGKARARIEELLFNSREGGDSQVPPYILSDKDDFGSFVNQHLSTLTPEELQPWYKWLRHCSKATQGKPTKRFLEEAKGIIEEAGRDKSRALFHELAGFVIAMDATETVHRYTWQGREYSHSSYGFLSADNSAVLKGLSWSMLHFSDSKTLSQLAALVERCFKKMPGVGPAAAGVGNAGIYSLAHSRGLEGVSHLSRIKLRITQNNTRKLIQKYLEEASAKRGVSTEEIEEMSVPDFDLTLGEKMVRFDDYRLGISVIGVGKTQLVWYKPDGQVQKTPPAFIRQSKKLSDLLKKVKAEVKQIQKYSTAQRDRIDRSFIQDRSMDYAHFVRYYHEHGLVSAISRKLLWNFTNGEQEVTGFWQDGLWQDLSGREVPVLPETTRVRLWHPIQTDTDTVLAWRDKLDGLSWQQPIKQVYREIYVLTDAEINTVNYSNRMAAHILKQHQFKALTGIRGWSYQLMGCYDDGVDGMTCRLPLPGWNMSAEYWINEIYMEDALNDAGIWDYVATDQLKFTDNNGQSIPLIDVPKIVFSEAMRDADLFVGVASVGNDPAWVDSGGERVRGYTDYWQSYSFGDLNEMAKTRKQVLERLVPRLKIKEVARIDGKFLRIKGKVREYKIHIGSTNILMEPNDQYLCIVPARGKSFDTSNLFIPFEGDRGLSLVLSKAFLLAADDKITDSTILSQIRR